MPKDKKPKSPKPSDPASDPASPIPAPALEAQEDVFTATALTPADRRFLRRAMRFLVTIQERAYAQRARKEGYTAAEHAEGWGLWRKAAGAERPLDHWFSERSAGGALEGGEQLRVLQEIDGFENTWFPRTRAIIRRVVPRDARDEFATVFFTNLEQQALGPGVIGSVSTFLSRFDDLAKSANPHARKVRATLERRGLTAAKIKSVRELLAQVSQPGKDAPPPPDAAALKKAQAEQMEALADLKDWFNDWATTLRSVFNARDQVKLGLTALKRAQDSDDVEDDEAEEPEASEDDEEPEDQDDEAEASDDTKDAKKDAKAKTKPKKG